LKQSRFIPFTAYPHFVRACIVLEARLRHDGRGAVAPGRSHGPERFHVNITRSSSFIDTTQPLRKPQKLILANNQ